MLVNVETIMAAIERKAPLRLAESWDNIGLLVGDRSAVVRRVFIALDLTAAVLEEAIAAEADLIITHHPFIHKALKNVLADDPQGAILLRLIREGIALYAAHTNLDAAVGGVNDTLAAQLGLENVRPFGGDNVDRLMKLVVYVPPSHLEQVWEAMGSAGAGHIGQYSHCSFRTPGIGTFLPHEGSKPFIGRQGEISRVEESRLETVAPESLIAAITQAMLKAHPYEEPAYDLYRLENRPAPVGLARIGSIQPELSLREFAGEVQKKLNLPFVKVAGNLSGNISSVAVCGGSGMSFAGAALLAGADVFLTGDVKYHDAQDAVARGMAIIDGGHFGTEIPVVAALAEELRKVIRIEEWDCAVLVAEAAADVFTLFTNPDFIV